MHAETDRRETRRRGRGPWRGLLALAAALVLTTPLAAQTPAARTSAPDQGASPATRQELRSRLDRLEKTVASRPGSQDAREARERLDVIRRRLEQGDFQPGDVVRLTARPDTALNGTFRVNEARELELPTIPDVDLAGVLYAEADSVVRRHVAEYIRDPAVRVQVTRRIAVLGAVQSPGFYDLAPSTTLSDVLMAAGGPTGNAELDDIELRRNGKNVLEGRDPSLQRMTLADLGPSRDDQLVVPQQGGGFGVTEALGVISSVSGVAWAITRIF